MSATQTSSREQRWEFQTRQILINDETVRLYRLNSRTWSSEWRDIEDFDRRTRKAFVTGRHAYLKMLPDRPSKEATEWAARRRKCLRWRERRREQRA
jgi:hypothetical protein